MFRLDPAWSHRRTASAGGISSAAVPGVPGLAATAARPADARGQGGLEKDVASERSSGFSRGVVMTIPVVHGLGISWEYGD